MRSISVLAYLFDDLSNVGSRRSRALVSMLQDKGAEVSVAHRGSFGKSRPQVMWALYVIRMLYRSKPDKIYISCGPYQILAFLPIINIVCRDASILIDFRDPFSTNMRDKGFSGWRYYFLVFISRWMEKAGYYYSDYFIVCTDGMLEEYRKVFNDDSKLKLILNGHDIYRELIKKIVNNQRKKKSTNELRMVCIGKLYDLSYNYRKPGTEFLKYLSDINKGKHVGQISLDMIGGSVDESFYDILKELDLTSIVSVHPHMPYSQAIEYAATFDVGIVILSDQKTVFGTKIYDYIAMGIPVLDIFDEDAYIRKRFSRYIVKYESLQQYIQPGVDERMEYSRSEMMKELVTLVLE